MGKAYANRKKESDRPESDYYCTPKSLVWELLKPDVLKGCKNILEPCCGTYSMSEELKKAGFNVTAKDIKYGDDFLESEYEYGAFDAVVTNPPFSRFDDIINKAKNTAKKVVMIGKTNFFGAYGRHKEGLWKGLKEVYIFNRQLDYRTPQREDGMFYVGNLVTCWMVWDADWKADWWSTKIIDVQKYATLGCLESRKKTEVK